jgi:hypothetical protein
MRTIVRSASRLALNSPRSAWLTTNPGASPFSKEMAQVRPSGFFTVTIPVPLLDQQLIPAREIQFFH